MLVRPGETLPADGVVVDGDSAVSEAMLTGESLPVSKAAGARVVGGSLNQASPLVVRVERLGADTRLASIVRLLDRAQSEKPRIGQIADRGAAAWFVGLLLVITVLVGATWYAIDPAKTLWIVVSVLVVTCPCALGPATPAALTTATGRLTRLGLLGTRAAMHWKTLARATDLVFDKTGTLTLGRLSVRQVVTLDGRSEADASACAAAPRPAPNTPSPAHCANTPAASLQAHDIRNTPGRGVEGCTSRPRLSPRHAALRHWRRAAAGRARRGRRRQLDPARGIRAAPSPGSRLPTRRAPMRAPRSPPCARWACVCISCPAMRKRRSPPPHASSTSPTGMPAPCRRTSLPT